MKSDDGFTLMEVLISLALIGIGVSALLTGLMTAVRATSSTEGYIDNRQVLISSAERIVAAPYAPCAAGDGATNLANAYKSTARDAVQLPTTPQGTTAAAVEVVTLQYWNGTVFTTSCSYDSVSTAKSRMQRIKLRVGTESLLMLKRQGSGAP